MKKIILLVIIVIASAAKQSYGQNKKMDSLKVELNKATQDTLKLKLYHSLCTACESPKDLLKYTEPAILLADKLLSQTRNYKERKYLLEKKAEALMSLVDYYWQTTNDTAEISKNIKKTISVCLEAKDSTKIALLYLGYSNYYRTSGNYQKAIQYYQKSLSLSKKLNFKEGLANCEFTMGIMNKNQGNVKLAIEHFKNGISIWTEIKDTARIANDILILGDVYCHEKDIQKAIENYKKAVLLYELKKNYNGVGIGNNKIGNIYIDIHDWKSAMLYFNKVLSSSLKLDNKFLTCQAYRNIGRIYLEQNDIKNALDYNFMSLNLAKELNDDDEIIGCYDGLAHSYLKQKDYKKAKNYSDLSLEMKKKHIILKYVRDAELFATEIDSASGNVSGAYKHFKEYILLRDKLKSDEVTKMIEQEKYSSTLEKQQIEQDKKDALTKAESKKQKLITLFIGLGLLIVLIFSGFVFRSLRIRNKQNKIITEQKHAVEQQKDLVEEKQREILDSIEYALRIQTAILPPTRIVKQYLENSFILYKPKDIVAGDFYWMEQVSSKLESPKLKVSRAETQLSTLDSELGTILFAACDCTGHGVPGAMVSVVCHNALNRAVREFGLTQPAAILDKTAEIVIENFSKSEEDIKDGMDISLVSLKFESSKSKVVQIEWAGANNPLWIVRKVDTPNNLELGTLNFELIETKADKQPIGMNEDSKPFTNHSFTLNTGDVIYLFTDGFADQFGGETGEKKLTRKRFKELLLSIQHKSMQEQCIALDNFIVDYRKQVEQIDDILVMGVRV